MKVALGFVCLVVAALAGTLVWHLVRTRASQRESASPVVAVSQSQRVEPPPTAPNAASPSASTQPSETERRLGPFSISGNSYTVILHLKPRQPGSTQETGDSVVAIEIQDSAGAVQYQRRLPYQETNDSFSNAWFASANPLAGTNGSGLLVSYSFDSEPSAPEEDSPDWWQIFGVVAGKLKPFSAPLQMDKPVGLEDSAKSSVYKSAGPLGSGADEIQFPVWTGHFRLIYPVRVDWTNGTLSPVQPCSASAATKDHPTADGQTVTATQSANAVSAASENPACQYKVLPESDRQVGDTTFVTLCSAPLANCPNAEKVVVKSNSDVALLFAQVGVQWNPGASSGPSANAKSPRDSMDDAGGVGWDHHSDVWLKVRIDDKEGWMHGEEDFTAFGLPGDE
jgi:hypothetical protein